MEFVVKTDSKKAYLCGENQEIITAANSGSFKKE